MPISRLPTYRYTTLAWSNIIVWRTSSCRTTTHRLRISARRWFTTAASWTSCYPTRASSATTPRMARLAVRWKRRNAGPARPSAHSPEVPLGTKTREPRPLKPGFLFVAQIGVLGGDVGLEEVSYGVDGAGDVFGLLPVVQQRGVRHQLGDPQADGARVRRVAAGHDDCRHRQVLNKRLVRVEDEVAAPHLLTERL